LTGSHGTASSKRTPLLTTTPYCYEAFLQVADYASRGQRTRTEDGNADLAERYQQILASDCSHAASEIKDFPVSANASSCSYTLTTKRRDQWRGLRAVFVNQRFQVWTTTIKPGHCERNLNSCWENQNANGSGSMPSMACLILSITFTPALS